MQNQLLRIRFLFIHVNNQFMKRSIILFIIISFCLSGCNHKNQQVVEKAENTAKKTIVLNINLSKSYPEKKIYLQDIADVEYVPLETRSDVLVDDVFGLGIFDSCIVICNFTKGDFLFFNRKGKYLNGFNRKGNSGEEYRSSCKWLYDNKDQEIFVYDNILFRILAYSQNGQFKREISLPRDRWFERLYSFNENLLLAQKKDVSKSNYDIAPNDYVLISKKNGDINSTIKKVQLIVPTSFTWKINGEDIYVKTPMGSIIRDGENFLLSDISSDTIYLLNNDKQLTPFLIRTPSVSGTKLPISLNVSLKTDKYVFLDQTVYNTESKDINDFFKGGKSIGIDMVTNEIFEPEISNKDFPDNKSFNKMTSYSPEYIGKNMGAKPIYSYI